MVSWKTLNIEPTDDKKTIKKAYAVLIKQYKPDEYPEKFQEIQQAYKQALQWAKEQNIRGKVTTTQDQYTIKDKVRSSQETPADNDSSLTQTNEIDPDLLAQQKLQKERIQNLFQQLHEMAFAPLVVKSKVENWKFIEEYYKIDGLAIKSQIAKEVFKKVAELNVFQAKRNKTLLISARILKYFNHVFDWQSQWHNYQDYFPEYYFTVTFYYFDTDREFKNLLESRTGFAKRTWAFFIDCVVLSFFMYLITLLPLATTSKSILMVCVFMVLRLGYEIMSPTHPSIGKKYNSMIIIDEYGNSCSEKLIFLRHLYMNLSLIPLVYLMVSTEFVIQWWQYLLILLIPLINTVSWILGKGLLHDRLTNTLVIDR